MREKPRAAIRCYCLPLVHSSTTTISQYAKMKIFCLAHYSKANYIIQFMKLEWSVCFPHSGGTETKVKEIVSDIPPHTNQNIGIF